MSWVVFVLHGDTLRMVSLGASTNWTSREGAIKAIGKYGNSGMQYVVHEVFNA